MSNSVDVRPENSHDCTFDELKTWLVNHGIFAEGELSRKQTNETAELSYQIARKAFQSLKASVGKQRKSEGSNLFRYLVRSLREASQNEKVEALRVDQKHFAEEHRIHYVPKKELKNEKEVDVSALNNYVRHLKELNNILEAKAIQACEGRKVLYPQLWLETHAGVTETRVVMKERAAKTTGGAGVVLSVGFSSTDRKLIEDLLKEHLQLKKLQTSAIDVESHQLVFSQVMEIKIGTTNQISDLLFSLAQLWLREPRNRLVLSVDFLDTEFELESALQAVNLNSSHQFTVAVSRSNTSLDGGIFVDRSVHQILKSRCLFDEQPNIKFSVSGRVQKSRVFQLRSLHPLANAASSLAAELKSQIQFASGGNRTSRLLLLAKPENRDEINFAMRNSILFRPKQLVINFCCHELNQHDFLDAADEFVIDELGINQHSVGSSSETAELKHRIKTKFGAATYRVVGFLLGEGWREESMSWMPDRYVDFLKTIAIGTEKMYVLVENIEYCDQVTMRLIEELEEIPKVTVIATCFGTPPESNIAWQSTDVTGGQAEFCPTRHIEVLSEDARAVLSIMSQLGWGTCKNWLRFQAKYLLGMKHKRFKECLGELVSNGIVRVTPVVAAQRELELDRRKGAYPVLKFVSYAVYEYVRAKSFHFEKDVQFWFLVGLCRFIRKNGGDVDLVRYKYTVTRLTKWWSPEIWRHECLARGQNLDEHFTELYSVLLELRFFVAHRAKEIDPIEFEERLYLAVKQLVCLKDTEVCSLSNRVKQVAVKIIVDVLSNSNMQSQLFQFSKQLKQIAEALFAHSTACKTSISSDETLLANAAAVTKWKTIEFPILRAAWSFHQRNSSDADMRQKALEVANSLFESYLRIGVGSAEHLLELYHLLTISNFSVGNFDAAINSAKNGKIICAEILGDSTSTSKIDLGDFRGSHCPGGCCKIYEAFALSRKGKFDLAKKLGRAAQEYVFRLDDPNSVRVVSSFLGWIYFENRENLKALNVVREGIHRAETSQKRLGRRKSDSRESDERWRSFLRATYLAIAVYESSFDNQFMIADPKLELVDIKDPREPMLQIAEEIKRNRDILSIDSTEYLGIFVFAEELAKTQFGESNALANLDELVESCGSLAQAAMLFRIRLDNQKKH